MRRGLAALCAATVLALPACTSDEDAPPVAQDPDPAASEPSSPRTDLVRQIADLDALSLRGLDLPEVPDGLDEQDVLTAADTVRAMAVDAFVNRERWDAEPSATVLRSHLAIGGPRLYDRVAADPVLDAPQPHSQLFVSSFADDAQPLDEPHVVKAAWDVQEVDGPDGREPMVSLEVHALYSVGTEDEPRAVLMRRTIGIGGNDLQQVDSEKSWFAEVHLVGADECRFLTDGPIAPADVTEVQDYEEFLADAEIDEPIVPVVEMVPLAQQRTDACSG